MKTTDLVEIIYEGQAGVCMVPRDQLAKLRATNKSPRAIRQKVLARYRPDVLWREAGEVRYQHLEFDVKNLQQSPLSGGTELSQLIAKADDHLVAMRKTVQ